LTSWEQIYLIDSTTENSLNHKINILQKLHRSRIRIDNENKIIKMKTNLDLSWRAITTIISQYYCRYFESLILKNYLLQYAVNKVDFNLTCNEIDQSQNNWLENSENKLKGKVESVSEQSVHLSVSDNSEQEIELPNSVQNLISLFKIDEISTEPKMNLSQKCDILAEKVKKWLKLKNMDKVDFDEIS
ncbi:MAG: hypothetical protein MHPSP_001320, partial [Paramarteilia canceri]